MKVLLAGASGAIGIPITRQLIAHGHQVLGLTRDRAVPHPVDRLRLRLPRPRPGRPGLQRRRRPAGHLAGGLHGHGRGPRGPAAPPPPRWLFRLAAPSVASFAADTSMRVSNAKAKAELGWQPTFPTYRDGIRAAATEEVPWRSHGRSDAGTRSA